MKESSKLFVLFFFLCSLMFMGCSPIQKEKHTFSIGDKTFLLDGKPFLIKAAEMHYTRIHAEYWEHRIQMCKALGMNTICIYAFWNIHEQKEGEFDCCILPFGTETWNVHHVASRSLCLFGMGNGRIALVVVEKERYQAPHQ